MNAVDTFVRSGAFSTAVPLPFVLGRDLVGTVAEPAAGFAEGAPVWCNSLGHDGRQGAAAEFAVVPADRLYRLPAAADPVRAVAVLHPAATAFLALFTHGGLRAGHTVLVGGGTGNVGRAAIVLAARAGARVLTTASPSGLAECRRLGADDAFDYHRDDLPELLRAAAPDGLDVHLDTSGSADLDVAVELLARRGRIVLMAGMRARPPLPVGAAYTRDARLVGFVISNAGVGELRSAARRINQLLAVRALAPGRVETLPLSAAADAHRRVESGEASGTKLVLEV